MPLNTTFAGELLDAILNGTAIANLLDNAASAPLTNLYISLHSADPGAGGSQTTNELAYTGYARKEIARTPGSPAWTGSGATRSNAGAVTFAACTGLTGTAAWFAVGTLVSGAGKILSRGQITSPPGGLAISNGVTPSFGAGVLVVTGTTS